MTRALLARRLSIAARALPPDARRAFRAFLASLPGARGKRSKCHSWHRSKPLKSITGKSKMLARRTSAKRQGDLFE